MLECCVRLSSSFAMLCVAAKRFVQEQSYYWQPIGSCIWGIDWYQNEWPWPLFAGRIKVMSTIASHSPLNISETVRDEALFQKTVNRKWPMGIKCSRDRWRHVAPKDQTGDPNKLRVQYLENSMLFSNSLLWGSTIGYSSDSLASCYIFRFNSWV